MHKIKILTTIFLVLFCVSTLAIAGQNFGPADRKKEELLAEIIIDSPAPKLPAYEKLTYKVRWLGI
ncbi:MAG: hypothetical protein HQ572_01735, partial [Candidatus Omnitrophica bacterium]|nr:hypothetical protein [Candidatus Omnitrophota bacterium]